MAEKLQGLRKFLTEEQIANLPDQRGLRSWAFEPYLELHNDSANAALEPTLNSLRDEWLQSFERKPNPKMQCNFVNCLRAFLINLMRVHIEDDGLTVGIPSQKERLGNQVQYRPAFMSVHYYRKALKLLLDSGLVDMVKRGHRQENYGETSRYALSDLALKCLPVNNIRADDFDIGRRDEVILLKDTKHRLIRYEQTHETQTMRDNLRKLNDLLERSEIATTRPASVHFDFDSDFSGQATDLYRVFNNGDFKQGGRFYGGWWIHAKKHFRRIITINGEATIEADFKGLHPAILFAKNDLPIPPDPYALIPGVAENSALRGPAKTTFLALMNAGPRGTTEPKDFNAQKYGMTAKAFRQTVKDAFPMLPGIFGTGRGLFLQREDSDLAEQIMLHFVDKGIAILPIHDSFIVAEQHKDELVKVMQTTFQNAYGQTPSVTVV